MTFILETPGTSALRKGRRSEAGRPYFLTTVVHRRERLFADFEAARAMSSIFASASTWHGAELLAWVLMPDHAHALIVPASSPLSTVVERAKGRTAFRFNRFVGRSGPVWQKGFHERALRMGDDLRGVTRYLVANPLRAGFVDSIGDYPFWDCVWAGTPDWL